SNQVLVMGGMVEQHLTDAIAEIHDQDLDASLNIVDNDHMVNAMEVAIDVVCTRIIAKRQPNASDLRRVLAIIKTITDLVRIG
ncbi:PhoU domain-containing protein, partial [Aeromonas veronii]|uniref:PhoU domain-containing protein n=1 Tax=Aeromonas veronii TaxID=654 RepID=UPI0038B4B1E9